MQDYAQVTIDLYKSVAGVDKVKPAQTPFLVDGIEGSLLPRHAQS